MTFTEWLYNETGATHTFDLALSGNTWDAALSMVNTGPLSTGTAISFTIWVTVPVGASVGNRDAVTVTATSQSDPSTHDVARLETVATQFGYAFLSNQNEIAILDLILHTDAGTIDTSPYDSGPIRGAISPDGSRLAVTLRGSDEVLVVNTATNTPLRSPSVGDRPHGIAFSNDGAYAVIANQRDDTLSVIDTTTWVVTATLSVGLEPYEVATSPCLGKASWPTRAMTRSACSTSGR